MHTIGISKANIHPANRHEATTTRVRPLYRANSCLLVLRITCHSIKPIEESITSPIVLPSLSHKEQSFIHITLAPVYDATMMVPWNREQLLEIVRSLRINSHTTYSILIISTIQFVYKIVRSLRTICLQWSIEFIKIAHILQVSWRESFHPRHLML